MVGKRLKVIGKHTRRENLTYVKLLIIMLNSMSINKIHHIQVSLLVGQGAVGERGQKRGGDRKRKKAWCLLCAPE